MEFIRDQGEKEEAKQSHRLSGKSLLSFPELIYLADSWNRSQHRHISLELVSSLTTETNK